MSPALKKDNRRSYRNLLLAKGYQLSFTLLMVALTSGIMVWLGRQVAEVADAATEVAQIKIESRTCGAVKESAPDAPPSPEAPPPRQESAPGMGDGDARLERARPVVTTLEVDIKEATPKEDKAGPDVEKDKGLSAQEREKCLREQREQIDRVMARKGQITGILWAVGIFLVVGLSLYGLKMTHRVAGPLHKVRLYMAKVRDGKYDTVYNLRKGDDLVAFYEHFKDAHQGLRKLQEDDRDRLADLLALVDTHQLEERSPELKTAADELRKLLAEKEASLD